MLRHIPLSAVSSLSHFYSENLEPAIPMTADDTAAAADELKSELSVTELSQHRRQLLDEGISIIF